ncbi:MAG: hypothetical protein H7312_03945 [Tardiphaga sp.]|jgi:hypothetical protein|nr:hypothetical protein [Tardiphaga sp.]
MTSISAASSSSYQTPLQKLQQELQAEITSGKISTADQDALSSALTDIDSSLQAGKSGQSGTSAKASPDDLKSKINDLIAGEVSSGKLTADQATELQGVFKSAFAGGANGARGAGGPPPGGPPPSDGTTSADSASSTDSSTTDANDILQKFIASLQQSQATSSSSLYSANGTSSASASSQASYSALLIDYTT